MNAIKENLLKVLLEKNNLSKSDLFDLKEETLSGMADGKEVILRAIKEHTPIHIVNDYDVDGITSGYIMYRTLSSLSANVSVKQPERKQGYGLSMEIIDRIDDGLIITVDNGIAAIEPLKKAKEKGLRVVIIDHHPVSSGGIPIADVVIDPHAYEKDTFKGYCAAGLAYKMAKLLTDEEEVLNECAIMAAIGTVADIMPLIKENRLIVQRGLELINAGKVTNPGLKALLEAMNVNYHCSAMDIGFKIGPAINACGRILDDGASFAFSLFTSKGHAVFPIVNKMIETNDLRKNLTAEGIKQAEEYIGKNEKSEQEILVLPLKDVKEGIAGIIAGKIAERYQKSTIVLSKTEDKYKGSGRSFQKSHHLNKMLTECSEYMLGGGGHKEACGLSVGFDQLDAFTEKIECLANSYPKEEVTKTKPDFVIESKEMETYADALEELEPYGQGFRPPVFEVKLNLIQNEKGEYFTELSSNGMKFNVDGNLSALTFGKGEEYKKSPTKEIIGIGDISKNYYYCDLNDTMYITPQLMINELIPVYKKPSMTSLEKRLLSLAVKR